MAIVAALAGWWLSLDLTRLSYGVGSQSAWVGALCGQSDSGPGGDCLSVLHAPQARVPIFLQTSIPVAVVGMAYFAFLAVWNVLAGLPARRYWFVAAIPLIIVGLGLMQSLYFVHVMRDVLHRWCGMCLAVHGLNAVLALAMLGAFPWRRGADAADGGWRTSLAALVAGLAVAGVHITAGLFVTANVNFQRVYEQYRLIVEDPEYVRWYMLRQPLQERLLAEDLPYEGPAEAAFSMVVFTDYQCPACRRLSRVIEEVQTHMSDRLRIAYIAYPLDRECNSHVPVVRHPGSCRLARAAVAAERLGAGRQAAEFRRLLFSVTADPQSADLRALCAQVGLAWEEFVRLLDDAETRAAVAAGIELAQEVGVSATPTVFLNGRRLPPLLTTELLERLLQSLGEADTSHQ